MHNISTVTNVVMIYNTFFNLSFFYYKTKIILNKPQKEKKSDLFNVEAFISNNKWENSNKWEVSFVS